MIAPEMIAQAFANTFNPMCLFLIWFGTVIGIIFGSIPGLSATMAVVLFLPLTFGMETTQGLALLCGLYMGGISGGLISAILLKIPGTPSSISTVFDGGPMAERGEAGRALGVGILYSFLGSILGIFALMFVSPLLARVCLLFGAADYFAVAVFALSIIASLSGKDMLNGLIAGLIGIMLSTVGMAPIDAVVRFTFGNYQLMSGFDITVLLIGVFAITDIIISGFEREHLADKMEKKKYQLKGYGLSVQEFIQQIPNTIISAVIGIGIGILPGIGGSTSGLLAYTAARNRSKYPEKFGTGNIGALVAQKAHFGFNMNVIAYDPFAKNVPEYIHLVEDRDEIFKQADFVSLHVPALPSTIHSVSDREFDLMKETAYLINTARGAIVDEPALIRALQEKKIAGAGLDTVEKEPFDLDNPLLSMENVVVAPHIGGATQEASTRSSVACAIAIDDFFAGRTPKFVVPELRELIAK